MTDDRRLDDAQPHLTGQGQTLAQPRDVGRKFQADGRVMPFGGNTMLCHIAQGSSAHRALTEAQAALRARPEGAAFAWLPPGSFHMTVFEGVADPDRQPGHWPAGLATDLPVAAVTDIFAARLARCALPRGFTIRPTGIFGGFSVMVTGASPLETARLWQARELLRDATGIRRPDFDSYRFHITLGYPLRWLETAAASAFLAASTAIGAELIKAAPFIELGAIEFCRFDDMHRFDRLRDLG